MPMSVWDGMSRERIQQRHNHRKKQTVHEKKAAGGRLYLSHAAPPSGESLCLGCNSLDLLDCDRFNAGWSGRIFLDATT